MANKENKKTKAEKKEEDTIRKILIKEGMEFMKLVHLNIMSPFARKIMVKYQKLGDDTEQKFEFYTDVVNKILHRIYSTEYVEKKEDLLIRARSIAEKFATYNEIDQSRALNIFDEKKKEIEEEFYRQNLEYIDGDLEVDDIDNDYRIDLYTNTTAEAQNTSTEPLPETQNNSEASISTTENTTPSAEESSAPPTEAQSMNSPLEDQNNNEVPTSSTDNTPSSATVSEQTTNNSPSTKNNTGDPISPPTTTKHIPIVQTSTPPAKHKAVTLSQSDGQTITTSSRPSTVSNSESIEKMINNAVQNKKQLQQIANDITNLIQNSEGYDRNAFLIELNRLSNLYDKTLNHLEQQANSINYEIQSLESQLSQLRAKYEGESSKLEAVNHTIDRTNNASIKWMKESEQVLEQNMNELIKSAISIKETMDTLGESLVSLAEILPEFATKHKSDKKEKLTTTKKAPASSRREHLTVSERINKDVQNNPLNSVSKEDLESTKKQLAMGIAQEAASAAIRRNPQLAAETVEDTEHTPFQIPQDTSVEENINIIQGEQASPTTALQDVHVDENDNIAQEAQHQSNQENPATSLSDQTSPTQVEGKQNIEEDELQYIDTAGIKNVEDILHKTPNMKSNAPNIIGQNSSNQQNTAAPSA